MKEMYVWEVGLINLQKESGGAYFDTNKEEVRNNLSEIYNKFLTKKERKTGRLAALNFGLPTEYNPDVEKITSIEVNENQKKIIIETIYKTYLEFKRKYTIKILQNEFKIDKREDFSPLKEKWVAVTF